MNEKNMRDIVCVKGIQWLEIVVEHLKKCFELNPAEKVYYALQLISHEVRHLVLGNLIKSISYQAAVYR